MNVPITLLAGVAAAAAWFVVGGALYMNPLVARAYKNAQASPALKKWPNVPKYIGLQFVGILVQCLAWAFVFNLVKAALPGGVLAQGAWFGLILTAAKILGRLVDMWLQTTYPGRLLALELVNGVIGSFVIAFVLAAII